MKIFKFGGASVKDSTSIKNVGCILEKYQNEQVLIVVSAMGKTTNLIEGIIRHFFKHNTLQTHLFNQLQTNHNTLINELGLPIDLSPIFKKFTEVLSLHNHSDYAFLYDQVIGFGEILSSAILQSYLNTTLGDTILLDVRELIKTDSNFQNANVCWDSTTQNINQITFNKPRYVTQGFIASDLNNTPTTLGREGSDFSAAIFASILNVESLTIWKDVDGFFNADPRIFEDATKYDQISYREAIELAYYGASVVHPKTIQPLKRKDIKLYVRSFLNLDEPGTLISENQKIIPEVPSIIVKKNLFLLSVSTKQLSFIVEKELETLFGLCHSENVRMILMQNSATSCSLVLQNDPIKIPALVKKIQPLFQVKFNEGVELYTIRHYNQPLIDQIYKKGRFILEERNNKTIQILIQP